MFSGVQKAVVTGGVRGLGRAVAESIVAKNGRVCLLDIDASRGEETAKELGNRAHFIQCDIRDPSDVSAALERAKELNEGLNLAVGCAGILGAARIIGRKGPMDPAHFKRVIDVNLIGSFNLTQAAAINMMDNEPDERNERGVIIHTASIAAYEGQVGQTAYSASKAGVVGMILPSAREFADKGIRVVGIAPGVFETPMMGEVTDEVRNKITADIPFPSRMGKPEEFASMVQHVVDNQMLNGSVIRLDAAARLK